MAMMNMGTLAVANNQFSLDLYRTLITPQLPKNSILSPFSIFSALAMLDVGAQGGTRDEILSATRLTGANTLSDDSINTSFQSLFNQLAIPNNTKSTSSKQMLFPSDPTTLTLANRIYVQTGVLVHPKFLAAEKESYTADVGRIDFKRDPKAATTKINKWVADVSNGKLQNFLTNEVTKSTQMLLVSALYLQAQWDQKFPESQTHNENFFLSSGGSVKVQMMHTSFDFGHYADFPAQDATGLLIPYAQGTLHMIFILPNSKSGLRTLENSLSTAFFDVPRYQDLEVDVSIPKFQINDQYQLVDGLKKLGINSAFGKNADFSGMTKADNFKVENALHKIFIAVDETGTEAVAATAVQMLAGAVLRPESMKRVFKANHPFIFAIQHRDTGVVLFLGKVENPSR